MAAVTSGLEIFLREKAAHYRGRGIGLIANAASVDSSLRSAVRLLASATDLSLIALFGPEHGMLTGAQDMVRVTGERDAATGLRVHSLYGSTVESLTPTDEMLEGIDVLLADLQDVGARYYTFAATIALALEAIARR